MISVIVPIYNVERYIHRCINSILSQSYTDFELLLIDDGSPDNSGAICDEYAAKDSRVRVFHKPNGGVSSARNLGLDNARGEWVTFIDSDDWIEPEYLKTLYSPIDADIIVCSVYSTDGRRLIMDEGVCSPEYFIDKYSVSPMVRAPWGTLLKSDIINNNNIRFDPLIRFGEDMIFNMQYLMYANTVRLLGYIGYNYYQYQDGELLTKKYSLTLDETKYSLEKSLTIKEDFNKKKGANLSYEIDYMVYLGLWPIVEMSDNNYFSEYYRLCKSIDSTLDSDSFYNHKFFSPIIRGLSEMKVCYQNKSYVKWLKLCDTLNLISLKVNTKLKFSYKDFYIWYWLIKNKSYRILSFLLKMYFISKSIVCKVSCKDI